MPDTNPTQNCSIPNPNHSSQKKIKESLLPLPTEIFYHIMSFFGDTRPIARLKEAARSELIPETPFCKIMDMVDKHFPHNYEWMFKVLRAHEQKGNHFITWNENYQVLKTLFESRFTATIEKNFPDSSKEQLQNFQKRALTAMLENLADFETQLETLLQEAVASRFEEYFPANYQTQLKNFREKRASLLLWGDNYYWLKELFHDDSPHEYQSLTDEFQQYEELTQLLQYYENILKQFKLKELKKSVMDPCQFYYDILTAYDCQSFIFTRAKLKRHEPQTMGEARYLDELEKRGCHGFKEIFKYVKLNNLQAFNDVKPTEEMIYLLYYVKDNNDWSVFDWAKKLDKQKMLDRFWLTVKRKSLGDHVTDAWNFSNHIEGMYHFTMLHWGIACQQPIKNFIKASHISMEAILKTNIEGQNSLHFAARNKQLDWLEYLLNCLDKNKQAIHTSDRSGNTPLLTAAMVGNLKAVNLLLKHGASAGATNQKGQTLVSLLVSQLNMQHNDVRRITALHIATRHLSAKNLSTLLVTRGNEINVQGVSGNTPLHLAAAQGDAEKVKLLLNHGANLHLRNNKGLTALHFAARSSLAVVNVLRDAGAKMDLQDPSEQSLYLSAARGGNIDCMTHFKPVNAVEEINSDGENALHLAAISGNPKAVEYLIAEKFNVGAKNKEGHTPLDLAFIYQQKKTVLFLLKQQPDWHCSDKKEKDLLNKHLKKNPFLWAVLELREYRVRLTKEIGSKSNKFVLFNKEKNAATLAAKLAATTALERVILLGEDRAILKEHEALFDKKGSTLSRLKESLLGKVAAETPTKTMTSQQ